MNSYLRFFQKESFFFNDSIQVWNFYTNLLITIQFAMITHHALREAWTDKEFRTPW